MAELEVNPKLKAAYYAVRGAVTNRAQDIDVDLKAGGKYPFSKVIYCNIGNPQQMNQKPLTFFRTVQALVDAPFLLDDPKVVSQIPEDAVARAKEYIAALGGPNKTGAYSVSRGHGFIREVAAKYITERDRKVTGNPKLPACDADELFISNGASQAVSNYLMAAISSEKDAVLIPVPQYPLYSATLTLLGGQAAPYYLDEANGWAMAPKDLEETYDVSVKKGHHPKIIVVINPGNPTGQVYSKEVLEATVRFANKHDLTIIADEVYQENIYAENKKFISMRSVVLSMEEPICTKTRLVSLHSTSKGMIGECGRRGGYAEYMNFPKDFVAELVKLAGISLCSNVNGQEMVSLMLSPPVEGDASFKSHWEEYNAIFSSLKRRAKLLVEEVNKIPGMHSNEIEGAMYAFVSIQFPEKFYQYVKAENEKRGANSPADQYWALELLEKTGIVLVPGSGFGQKEGTEHFRITILPPEEDMESVVALLKTFQHDLMERYSK